MPLNELISLLIKVLATPEVIAVTVAIALYVNIVIWIVRYRKRPAGMVPRRKIRASAPAEKTEEEEAEEEEEEE